jgi:hypothetical protein
MSEFGCTNNIELTPKPKLPATLTIEGKTIELSDETVAELKKILRR